jgi:hypothetical protein
VTCYDLEQWEEKMPESFPMAHKIQARGIQDMEWAGMHRLVDQIPQEHKAGRQSQDKHKAQWEANHRSRRTNLPTTMDNNLRYRVHELMVATNAEPQGNGTRPALSLTNPALIVREVTKTTATVVMLVLQLQVQEPRLLL